MADELRPLVLVTSFYDGRLMAESLGQLKKFARVREVNRGRNLTAHELRKSLPGVYACVAADETYTSKILTGAKELAVIAREGTGYDCIDIEAATHHGILVTNAPVVHVCTANMTIGLMIALVRKVIACDAAVRANAWTRRDRWLSPDLAGMTLGIIGFGLVGREVAKRAIALGMHVVAYNRSNVSAAAKDLGVQVEPLDDVLSRSDVVSLHVRHGQKTRNMFNASMFSRMKKGSYFVNTARGGLVDEDALVDALQSGHLVGAALDVFAQEPPSQANRLLSLANVIVAPHTAGETITTVHDGIDLAVSQIRDSLAKRKPSHLVNPEAWAHARIHHL